MSKKSGFSLGSCIGLIIIALIALCAIFTPCLIAEGEDLYFAYKYLPIIGDGTFMTRTSFVDVYGVSKLSEVGKAYSFLTMIDFAGNGLGLGEGIASIISSIAEYSIYVYLGIFAVDVVMAILFIILRNDLIRKIFRLISIIFGIALILYIIVALAIAGSFAYTVSETGAIFKDALLGSYKDATASIPSLIWPNGILFFGSSFILGIFGLIGQFLAFRKKEK